MLSRGKSQPYSVVCHWCPLHELHNAFTRQVPALFCCLSLLPFTRATQCLHETSPSPNLLFVTAALYTSYTMPSRDKSQPYSVVCHCCPLHELHNAFTRQVPALLCCLSLLPFTRATQCLHEASPSPILLFVTGALYTSYTMLSRGKSQPYSVVCHWCPLHELHNAFTRQVPALFCCLSLLPFTRATQCLHETSPSPNLFFVTAALYTSYTMPSRDKSQPYSVVCHCCPLHELHNAFTRQVPALICC